MLVELLRGRPKDLLSLVLIHREVDRYLHFVDIVAAKYIIESLTTAQYADYVGNVYK